MHLHTTTTTLRFSYFGRRFTCGQGGRAWIKLCVSVAFYDQREEGWGSMACQNTTTPHLLYARGHYCLSSQTSLLVCPKNTVLLPGPLSPLHLPGAPWYETSTNTAGPAHSYGAFPDACRQTFVVCSSSDLFGFWNSHQNKIIKKTIH